MIRGVIKVEVSVISRAEGEHITKTEFNNCFIIIHSRKNKHCFTVLLKVVLYPKFDEMCGFRKITKRGLLNVLKRIHVTFSIAIHSKSRYSANSASG